MSVAGEGLGIKDRYLGEGVGLVTQVSCLGRGGRYSKVTCVMGTGHMGSPWTQTPVKTLPYKTSFVDGDNRLSPSFQTFILNKE